MRIDEKFKRQLIIPTSYSFLPVVSSAERIRIMPSKLTRQWECKIV